MAFARRVGWALGLMALLIPFQNCSQTRFSTDEFQTLLSGVRSHDGQVFDGKLRILHHLVDGFTCENHQVPEAVLVRNSATSWHWIQNKKEKCAAVESDVDVDLVQYDDATRIAHYQGNTYVPPKPYNVLASEDPNLPDVNLLDGICADVNGLCSLRAAVEQSNPTALTEPVIVNVPAGTFNLTDSLKIQLLSDQSNAVTIRGVDAQSTILDGGNATRHLAVRSLTTSLVSIEKMTLQNGTDSTGLFSGSSLQISADPYSMPFTGVPDAPDIRTFPNASLSISDCIFRNNKNSPVIRQYVDSGALQIHRSQFLDNQFSAIYSINANGLLIEDSNFARAGDRMLTLRDNTGAVTIRNSSFSDAYVGVSCVDCRNLTLENITIFQNIAGGLEIMSDKADPAFDAVIRQATIYNNATVPMSGQPRANLTLGFSDVNNSITMSNSIIAQPVGGPSPNCSQLPGNYSRFVVTNTLFSDTTCMTGGSGNLYVDPQLAAPAQNGGLGMTFLPLAGSPVLDSGSNALCTATDQRGLPRLTSTGPAARCDMGAVEVQ